MKTPDHQAARPNVPFNSSSTSVFLLFLFFFFFLFFSLFFILLHPTLCPPPAPPDPDYVSLSLPVPCSLSLPSHSLPLFPFFSFFLFFIRYVSVRERSAAAAGHRKYISVEKLKRPPYVRHHFGRTDGRTDKWKV